MSIEIINIIHQHEVNINDIEIEIKSLLNYGNVPNENWDKVYKLMIDRSYIFEVVEEFKALLKTIENNNKPTTKTPN